MALRVGKDPFTYINEVKVQKSRQSMKRRLQEYAPNQTSVDKLERVDEKFYLIIFSADWCSDCLASHAVDGPRDNLFSRAALAGDEHGGGMGGHARGQLHHPPHGG